MKKFSLAIFTIFSFFTFSVCAKTYLFVGADFPDILEETSDRSFKGVGAEIAKEVVEGLGHKIKIELYPWARAQRMIQTGDADFIIGPYKTATRSKFMDYSDDHFYTGRTVFYTKKDRHFVWDGDLLSFKEEIIGTTRGWSYGPDFDQIKHALTLEPVKELCTNFEKLMVGRVTLIPAMLRNALVCIEELNISEKVSLLSPDMQRTKGYFGFSKKKKLADFKEKFDKKLKEMVDNGRVLAINTKYHLKY